MTREYFFKHPFSIPTGSKVTLHWTGLKKKFVCYFKGYNVFKTVKDISDLYPVFVRPDKNGGFSKSSSYIFNCCEQEKETYTGVLLKELNGGIFINGLKWDKITVVKQKSIN